VPLEGNLAFSVACQLTFDGCIVTCVAACRACVAVAMPSVVAHYGTVVEGERDRSMMAAAVAGRVRTAVVTGKLGLWWNPGHWPCLCQSVSLSTGFVIKA
jgi:hypothetical protein